MGLDLFREVYMNINGEMLDFPEAACIFAKRLGRYILWVGVIEPERDKNEPIVIDPTYFRFAIIELGEKDGEIIVKDYMFVDITGPEALELVQRIKFVESKMFVKELNEFGISLEPRKKRKKKAKQDDDMRMFG